MKRIKTNYAEQGVLFSTYYVGDRLAEDDEVYSFKNLLDNLDISPIMNEYGEEGGSMYCPKSKLAVILYAFLKGITSSVKIAELVRNSLPFIYLAGGHIISRRALSEFRLKHLKSIRKIFNQTIDLSLSINLVKPKDLFTLDGSKLESDTSPFKTRSKLEWEIREKQIEVYVNNFLDEWAKNDNLEENHEKEHKVKFQKMKEKLEEILKAKNESSKDEKPTRLI